MKREKIDLKNAVLLIIMALFLIVIGWNDESVDNTNDTNNGNNAKQQTNVNLYETEKQDVNNDIKVDKVDSTNEKTILSINSDDYIDYVNSIVKEIYEGENVFSAYNIMMYSPYIKIYFYTSKTIKPSVFKNDFQESIRKFYEQLSKNNYKSGGFFANDYEYINIYFDNKQEGSSVEEGFIQINILNLNQYKTFEDFYNDSKNMKYEGWKK